MLGSSSPGALLTPPTSTLPVAQVRAGSKEWEIDLFRERVRNARAFCIDIDDTLLRFRPRGPESPAWHGNTGSLLDVLREAAVKLAGMQPEATEAILQRVLQENAWWHWSDFIIALDLDPAEFWDYAYQREKLYLEATESDLYDSLEFLKQAGYYLFVASNNASSGIFHKLRLAGLGSISHSPLFAQVFGVSELRVMKWEPLYWKQLSARCGISAGRLVTIGDNPRDDAAIPLSVGYAASFLLSAAGAPPPGQPDRIAPVSGVAQIRQMVQEILGSAPGASVQEKEKL